jgi:hypothetical protein
MLKLVGALLLTAAQTGCGTPSRATTAIAPSTVTTVDGRVLGVDGVPPERRLGENLRVTLRAGSEPIVVELAPGWYLEHKGLRFERNQSISVEGTVDRERDVFIARRVHANSLSVDLRDAEGRELWPDAAPDAGVLPTPSTRP